MKHLWLSFFLALGSRALGADLPGFVVYKGADLRAYEAKLAREIKEVKFANANLDNFGNHSTMIAHREGPGMVEIHEVMTDVFVVESGEAMLVVGGEPENVKTVGPGEMRGSSVKGGERRKLGAGDIVHIPAKMPHQLLLAPGKQFTYFVLKVETK